MSGKPQWGVWRRAVASLMLPFAMIQHWHGLKTWPEWSWESRDLEVIQELRVENLEIKPFNLVYLASTGASDQSQDSEILALNLAGSGELTAEVSVKVNDTQTEQEVNDVLVEEVVTGLEVAQQVSSSSGQVEAGGGEASGLEGVKDSPAPRAGESGIEAWYKEFAGVYGVDEELLRAIGACESGHNPQAVNGPYGGMFQFHGSTWSSTRAQMGLDGNPELRFVAEEAIKTAAFKIAQGGAGAWKNCLAG